jgi:hypothetical protein
MVITSPPEAAMDQETGRLTVPVASAADTVPNVTPDTVGVPEITPVDALIDNPGGRPAAEYARVWPDTESVALS